MFILSVWIRKTLFWQIWCKKSKLLVKMKLGTQANQNKLNSMMVFTFSASNRKYAFWVTLVQQFKIIYGEVQQQDQSEYAEFYDDVHVLCIRPEIPFLGTFGQKHQNCLFKLKYSTYNHFHNILRLTNVLPNFLFTTSETMRDYYL